MEEEVKLPAEISPANLPEEATETKCVVKTGEFVEIMNEKYLKMPDGTLREDLKDCELQKGSGLVFHYENSKELQFVNSKPRKKVHPAPEVSVSLPDPSNTPTTVYDDTIPIIQVDPKQSNKQVGNNVGIDPMIAGAIGIAAVSAIAVSSIVNSAKLRNLTKLKQLQTQNNKRKEEQSKCNSNSDSVKSLISMTEEMVDTSPINRIEISPNEQFISRVDENNNELKKLNKKIRDLEDKLTKVKNV